MIENIRLSFQGIWAHKMRSFFDHAWELLSVSHL